MYLNFPACLKIEMTLNKSQRLPSNIQWHCTQKISSSHGYNASSPISVAKGCTVFHLVYHDVTASPLLVKNATFHLTFVWCTAHFTRLWRYRIVLLNGCWTNSGYSWDRSHGIIFRSLHAVSYPMRQTSYNSLSWASVTPVSLIRLIMHISNTENSRFFFVIPQLLLNTDST